MNLKFSLARDSPGEKVFLLGNEAIARGALEAGVGVATAYPGTPSTEIVEALSRVARELRFYVEWSVNEKVAFEVAYAASMCRVRALTAMKHVGLNVAMDPLMTSGYTGVLGGFVIVSADDPSCHSSQNEQDNRIVGLHAYLPVFEPSNVQEAKDLTKYAFEFSEEYEVPVILRTTTRLSHSRGPVVLGELGEFKVKGVFYRDPERWVIIPAHARMLREVQVEKWKNVKSGVEKVPYNKLVKTMSKNLIVASGLAYSYVVEALEALKFKGKVDVLKVSTPYPIPEKLVLKALEGVDRVLVVEELEPLVELEVKKLVYEEKLEVEVCGKEYIPVTGELNLDRVVHGISKFLNLEAPPRNPIGIPEEMKPPPRPPNFCPGCPHRATFYAIRRAVNLARVKAVYPSDIGCYTLGVNPPFKLVDTTICMGGSIGLANGFAHVEDRIPIATIGDSTFFHTGIPPLINAVYNKAPLLLVVLDNETTAMTGHQPHPGVGFSAIGESTVKVLIEDVVKAVGVEFLTVVDPYNVNDTVKGIVEALEYVRKAEKPAVVVSRRECSLVFLRRARSRGLKIPLYSVDKEKCTGCRVCTDQFSCPAIFIRGEKAYIDEALCSGCGVCAQICPWKAIYERGEG